MSRSPIEIMIDASDLRCTICGAKRGQCDCWTKCTKPGCAWSYRKGEACRNPEHKSEAPMTKVEEIARAICKEDGQDWLILSQTYNGRQRQHDYRRFAKAAASILRKRSAPK